MSRMQNSTCTARYKDTCTAWYSKLFYAIKQNPQKIFAEADLVLLSSTFGFKPDTSVSD